MRAVESKEAESVLKFGDVVPQQLINVMKTSSEVFDVSAQTCGNEMLTELTFTHTAIIL